MKLFYTSILLCLAFLATAQDNFNLELVSNATFPEAANDIWGYVSETGTEYALVGTVDNTRIYNLSDPENPRQIAMITGDNTVWRDLKSFEDHVYVTADNASDGLLVIDMSQVESDSIRYQFLNPAIPTVNGDEILSSCHNIYIDEADGFAYLAGCGSGEINKAVIFDLKRDKFNPTLVGAHGDGYAHDVFVRDNLLYSSEIFSGELRIFDVTNKDTLILLGETNTSTNFTHNTWVSDDGNYAYTTDERGGSFVDAYDITDFGNIQRLDVFQPLETAGQGVVPHNTHFLDEYLVTSWYTDGVVITDVSRPSNMVKVGAYDTFFGANGGTNGCWGAYPYLPSGLVLATDRANGLFVLRPNYERACWLEGTVTDAGDGSGINGVTVSIEAAELNGDATDVSGDYATGLATAGEYVVTFFHPEYGTLDTTVQMSNGVVTELNVELALPPIVLTGRFIDASTGLPISNGVFQAFANSGASLNIAGDTEGGFTVNVFDEPYITVAGAWGYQQLELVIQPELGEIVIELEPGYMDDFVLDLGWIVTGTASAGIWERAVPVQTNFNGRMSNIGSDIDGDLGDECYVTGNGGGGAGTDDVDNGMTILTSPTMQLNEFVNPELQFYTYFFNDGGSAAPGPDDRIDFTIFDGFNLFFFEEITESLDDWSDIIRIRPTELGISLDENISLIITTGDNQDNGNLVEAAIDVFRVEEATPSATTEITNSLLAKVFPNPTNDFLFIESYANDINQIQMYTANGQKVIQTAFTSKLDVQALESGIYILELVRNSGDKLTSKILIK